jgi:anti-sigma factor RsiW
MNRHIDELAELFALGSLSESEKTAVDRHVRTCVACANRIRAAEETIAFIADLEEHHEPPETIAETFAARLALSRVAQKLLSLKVIATVLIVALIVLAFAFRHVPDQNASMGKGLADANQTLSVQAPPTQAVEPWRQRLATNNQLCCPLLSSSTSPPGPRLKPRVY